MAVRPTFVDEIPFHYERYLAPLVFQYYAADLAQRIMVPAKGKLLETAAGTGLATRLLRYRIPADAQFFVTDISSDMLETASQHIESNGTTSFQTANAMALPFTDNTFDAVCCQFSMMFFDDKLKAMQETWRVLKPGGTFTFNTWDSIEQNEFANAVDNAVTQCLPIGTPSLYKVPYGCFDTEELKTLLMDAGFKTVHSEKISGISVANQAKQVAKGFILGTPARIFIEKYAPGTLSNVMNQTEKAIIQQFGSHSINAKMQAIVFQAQKD